MEEIYRSITDYPDYKISNLGNVKSFRCSKEKILKLFIAAGGYYRVNLTNEDGISHLLVHRLIAKEFIPNPDNLLYIDHIDGDKLNNKVENLRWATRQQNNFNATKYRKHTSSKYKGVRLHTQCNKFRASITFNGKSQYLGLFDNEEDAANTYNEKAIELFGDFARLNIIG
jgi:HNH endonuclease/NUMOD4 motif